MRFSVVGGPLASTISLEAKQSDSFESIFKRVQEAVGKATPLDAYDLYTTRRSSLTGELVAAAGPLRFTDTPSALRLDFERSDPHILMLMQRSADNERGSTQNQLLCSTAAAGDASRPDSTAIASTSPSLMTTPRVRDEYRRRMRAMYLKYDPGQIHKVEVALDRYRGYEEDVLQQLVKRYGPEPAPGEVDLSPKAAAAPSSGPDARESMPSHSASTDEANPHTKPSYYDRLVAIYSTYEPAKLSKVNGTLRRYAGREEEVIQQLVKKYGPEPSTEPVAAAKVAEAASEQLAPTSGVGRQQLTSSATHAEASAHASATVPAVEEQVAAVPEATEASAVPLTNTAKVAAATIPAAPPEASAYGDSTVGTQLSNTERKPLATVVSPLDGSLPCYTAVALPNKASAVESMAIGANYRERLVALYNAYNPAKLHTVEGTLKKFSGKEEVAIQQLVRRYGAEPAPLNREEARKLLTTAGAGGVPSTPPSASPTTTNAPGSAASSTAGFEPASSGERVDRVLETHKSGEEEVMAQSEVRYAAQRAKNIAGEPATSGAGSAAESGSFGAVVTTAQVSAAPPSIAVSVPPSHGNSPSGIVSASTPSTVASTKAASPVGPAGAVVATPQTTRVGTVGPAAAAVPHAQESKAWQGGPPQRRALPLAALRVAAAHVEAAAHMSLRERYWAIWRTHHAQKRAAVLLQQELWVKASAGAAGCYRLNDSVEPAYTVANLSVVVAQEERGGCSAQGRALSSELQIAMRALLASLRHCVESRVIQAQSHEEHQQADTLLTHWAAAENLCPVTDSPELACALHQAAHLIGKLEDLVTVIRTQAGQLHQLKALHRDVLERMEHAHANTQALGRLQAQLSAANNDRRALEQELERISAGGAERHARQAPLCRLYPTAEERKDAQVAKLQQELAKTRNLLFLSKEAEDRLKVQLQQSHTREARRKHEEWHRQGKSSRYSISDRAYTQPRSRSARAGNGPHSSPSNSPYRRYTPVSTPRGAFSYAIAHDTPRGPSTLQVHVNGCPVSSIRGPDAATAEQVSTSMSVNSSTPWPSSRYVMTPTKVDRGPCPNCLTPLTSCCREESGTASEKAAFCFSCRRYFTFGELWTCDGREIM
ncbi:conserved hypothetical protein [Leishmania major strain Friedlin]|uniref:Uncharacterized protein n=1 Tax=Leishmania major TaxID=5664 RepID=Q4Q1T7_LEIMA|nr:conserved hypothetical protein [Leishmania major strain Friedlin]CAG9583658.1 hypothetical_protein_-_conserved [Leishmania major strain Friedlin]CAJ09092.1 conserved hypothetical protein [Leishmania major strain Friedlin]|eukprot:XP_001686711.1 conserved hypothetical protein [Leishmania major strain Friedlin]